MKPAWGGGKHATCLGRRQACNLPGEEAHTVELRVWQRRPWGCGKGGHRSVAKDKKGHTSV